jgi:hypothetical protein
MISLETLLVCVHQPETSDGVELKEGVSGWCRNVELRACEEPVCRPEQGRKEEECQDDSCLSEGASWQHVTQHDCGLYWPSSLLSPAVAEQLSNNGQSNL